MCSFSEGVTTEVVPTLKYILVTGNLCVELHARVWMKSYTGYGAVGLVLCCGCCLEGEDKYLLSGQLSCCGCKSEENAVFVLYPWSFLVMNSPEKGERSEFQAEVYLFLLAVLSA